MRHEFDYELSKDEYIAGLIILMEQLRRQDAARARVLWEQIAGVIAIILIVMVFFPEGALALLVATLLVSVLQWVMSRRWLRTGTGISYDPQVARMHIEIDDSGVVEHSANRERRWSWDGIRQVHDTGALVVLELAGWDMLVLPARLWTGEAERKAFLDSLPAQLTRAEPLRANQELATRRGFPETVQIAALAAAVDALALGALALPWVTPRLPSGTGAAEGLAIVIGGVLLSCAFAYAALRFARSALPRLHESSPAAATVAAATLIWIVPIYLIAAYFEWI